MAYQTRQRGLLLDEATHAMIERRSKEILGLVLIVLGAVFVAMLASYAPTDPNFMTASDAPVQNLLGRFGAQITAPLFMVVGHGAWVLPLVLVAWGARFVLHHGQERALGRLVFLPVALAITSIYAATLVPGDGWTHRFGLGGLFGDTLLGAILTMLGIGTTFGIKALSLITAVAGLAMVGFVAGIIRAEARAAGTYLYVGLVMLFDAAVRLLNFGASKGIAGAGTMATRAAQWREARAEAQAEAPAASTTPILRADPPEPEEITEGKVAREGLLSRVTGLVRKPALDEIEPELIEAHLEDDAEIDAPGEDRIKAKIDSAIKTRVRKASSLRVGRVEPSLTLGRGPKPLVVDTSALNQPAPSGPAPFAEAEAEDEVLEDIETPQVRLAPAPVEAPAPAKKVVHTGAIKPAAPSRQAKAEAQPVLQFETPEGDDYDTPPLSLLASPDTVQKLHLSDEALEENARMLESVLDDYGVKGEIVSVRPGPVVTMYELEPAPGLKASRVIGLADDIARSMSALSARVSTVPGRSVIGIELPNENREKVLLREILAARDFGDTNKRLPLALGKDIGGDAVVANLAKMPHLLIAGTTGSGKSVAINTMILSLLYRLTPDECRLIMIDPKMLELSVYDGIPHLLSPVVTDPKKAVVALKWVVGEMEERYRKMSKMGVRNIEGYNGRVRDALSKGEMFSRTVQTGFDDETGDPVFETEEFQPEAIPYIVVIVDEMADLMMVAGKEIEACIQRLAQMARASGIHLIMATQRPSVDVITGTIKANFPTRISFQVTSKVDSRTILGEQGAEQLLGMGDMLYMAGGAKITRVHGPFVSDEEVEEIVTHLKAFGPPEYVGGVVDGPDEDKESNIDLVLGLGGNTDGEDALYDQAVAVVVKDRKCSTSYIQRKLAIGYNKAARLVEQMEDAGLVSAANHVGKREILVPEQEG